ncbi:MAG TPA: DNA polymerase III subunit gamma and tau [Mycobacteriales bacterium]|nr:DNA polymerase III subunit gamma and tau [Mycobacteriales bacterium]
MALALYRKYRPATFAEVVGQEHVTEPLIQALASGRVNHAYLFSGPRGCGKTSSARILARSLNCETRGPTPDPCGKCDSCIALAPDGPGSLDVIEIDAASHGGVDDARDLRERAFFAPVSSRYKVYIVDEAHMVSTQGFNALLKLVEEPPEFLVFVFATTEPEKVLTTIRSRTHHYPFRLIPPGVMRGLLSSICTAEGIAVEPTVLPLVVRAGGGSARDALSVLDQLIAGSGPEGVTYAHAIGLLGVTDGALLDEMVDALAAGDSAAVYETVDRVVEAGHDPRRFATDLLERLRDLVVLDAVPDANAKGLIDFPPDQVERMTDQAARLGTATLSRMADIVHTGLIEMRGTTSPRLLLELVSARMLLPSASADEGALLQRLERMERRLSAAGDPVEAPAAPVREAPAREVRAAPVREAPAGEVRAAPVREAPVREAPAGEAPAKEAAQVRPAPAQEEAAEARPRRAQQDEPEPQRPARTRPAARQDDAAPAEPQAPPERVHTPVGQLDAAAVRRIWPEVLDNVKRRRRTAHALLMNVSVQSVDNGVLTLTISSIPLSRLLAQDANTEVVRSAVKDVLGVDWRINVVVDGGLFGGGDAPPTDLRDDDPRDDEPSPPTADRGPARVDPEEAAISLLQSTLGAKRMDR